MAIPTLILASASPRRKDLLRAHGFSFRSIPANICELNPRHLTAAEAVLLNAKRKAEEVARKHPRSIVLGVDTLVALDNEILGKPADLAVARRMLSRLSGREHEVFSGVWIRSAGMTQIGFTEMSRVRFRPLSAKEINRYVETIHLLDKAGAYAAQEDPMGIIETIEGSRTNVIGLPMESLERALQSLKGVIHVGPRLALRGLESRRKERTVPT